MLMVAMLATSSAASPAGEMVTREALRAELNQFLKQELASHLGQIASLQPPPTQIHGAGATGDFTWGTFMRAVGAYFEMTSQPLLGGHDLAALAGRIGLLEHRLGSKAFSQLYAAQTLRHFGRDLRSNPLWQSLSEEERGRWRALLDVRRFYDPESRKVINLPENNHGLAARNAAKSYQVGLLD